MHRHVFALACLFGAAGWSSAASPDPADLDIPAEIQVKSRALVEQLGSDDFPEREDAQQQLADLGRLARPALLAGANTSPSPEVRLRCLQLLPKATTLDLKARLDTFLADTEGKYEHDLPAWKTFRSVVCREWALFGYTLWSDRSLEKAAREVFADLISTPANRRLLLAINGSRVELTELVVARKQELSSQRFPRDETPFRSPTLEEVAALLFADSRVGSQYLPRRGSSVTFLLSGSGFTQAARGSDEKGRVYRAIAAAWLDSRNEPREMSQVMSVATELGLNDQVCGLAARLLMMPGVTAPFRGRAASNLVYYGTKKHIPLLEKALANASAVYTVRAPFLGSPDATYEIQARDVSLAISILLAEQKPEDYGFTDRSGASGTETRSSYSYTRYYFEDDATRKKAFEKWTEWRKKHFDE
jgi:hypothetical protein